MQLLKNTAVLYDSETFTQQCNSAEHWHLGHNTKGTVIRSIVTFVFMGGITTVVHVLVGLCAHHFAGLAPFNANLVAFSVAFFLSYFLHKTYSFRSPGRVRRSMPRFFVVSATNLILNQLIVYVFSIVLGHPYWISLAIMVVVVPTFTYILSRVWVFDDGDF